MSSVLAWDIISILLTFESLTFKNILSSWNFVLTLWPVSTIGIPSHLRLTVVVLSLMPLLVVPLLVQGGGSREEASPHSQLEVKDLQHALETGLPARHATDIAPDADYSADAAVAAAVVAAVVVVVVVVVAAAAAVAVSVAAPALSASVPVVLFSVAACDDPPPAALLSCEPSPLFCLLPRQPSTKTTSKTSGKPIPAHKLPNVTSRFNLIYYRLYTDILPLKI